MASRARKPGAFDRESSNAMTAERIKRMIGEAMSAIGNQTPIVIVLLASRLSGRYPAAR